VVLAPAAGGMGAQVRSWIAAVYGMAIIPALLAFGFAQRWFMRGLQAAALNLCP
jgi:ABC-type glycerol-3-phosphate transport system permease component